MRIEKALEEKGRKGDIREKTPKYPKYTKYPASLLSPPKSAYWVILDVYIEILKYIGCIYSYKLIMQLHLWDLLQKWSKSQSKSCCKTEVNEGIDRGNLGNLGNLGQLLQSPAIPILHSSKPNSNNLHSSNIFLMLSYYATGCRIHYSSNIILMLTYYATGCRIHFAPKIGE